MEWDRWMLTSTWPLSKCHKTWVALNSLSTWEAWCLTTKVKTKEGFSKICRRSRAMGMDKKLMTNIRQRGADTLKLTKTAPLATNVITPMATPNFESKKTQWVKSRFWSPRSLSSGRIAISKTNFDTNNSRDPTFLHNREMDKCQVEMEWEVEISFNRTTRETMVTFQIEEISVSPVSRRCSSSKGQTSSTTKIQTGWWISNSEQVKIQINTKLFSANILNNVSIAKLLTNFCRWPVQIWRQMLICPWRNGCQKWRWWRHR